MKRLYTLILPVLIATGAYAQSGRVLNIDSCYVWAKQNYPLLKEHNVIQQTRDFTVQNAWRGYIPQLNVNGQATYQSETTNFADVFGSLPPALASSMKFPTYSKDQ